MSNAQLTHAPDNPLMQPVQYNGPDKPVTFYHYQHDDPIPWQGLRISIPDAEALLAVSSRIESLAHRLLFSPTDTELQELLRELVTFTSDLVRQGHEHSGPYALLMCLQMRCSDKIRRRRSAREYHEKQMYTLFRKHPQRYIPGVKIRTDIHAGSSRPDFFLDVNGLFAVAEFKYGDFRERHLYQLQEYMHRFNAAHGYAVAHQLVCTLPQNVTYVRMLI